ncbi:MAG: flavodoxin family protein [Acidimicrobiia bacterium]
MRLAIVYDSRTGTTKGAAEDMAEIVRTAGYECTVEPVGEADPTTVTSADAICVGSWTEGWFIVLQHATQATMQFIDRLGPLDGKPAAVFCTYKTATGKMLPKMAEALQARGASVTGQFRTRGPYADARFTEWVQTLAG